MADSQEYLYLDTVRMHHVEFGGLGGDIAKVILTREAHSSLGKPNVIRVTVEGVFEDEEE